jgi:6-pyruvoyltetrahydropterin/6-carboxytetrahydropterin synthase
MPEQFSVRIAKEQLVFCAAHFISYEGDKCERLHGHNYQVRVEVAGPLDDNRYVFDFIALKRLLRSLVDSLDHRMLVPLHSSLIRVAATPEQVEIAYRQRRWLFPRDDCMLLPVANTTAEELARYLCQQLHEALRSQYGFAAEWLVVEVEEGPGQSAVYRWQPRADGPVPSSGAVRSV